MNERDMIEMTFFEAMTTADVRGENLMPTHSTSGSYVLDWFFWMGGARGKPASEIIQKFAAAYHEDHALALKALFNLRDVRGGMGERRTFRVAARWMAYNFPQAIKDNLANIPYYGRWDDVLAVAIETPAERAALAMIWGALSTGDRLCAKWMPREGKSLDKVAKYLMERFNMSPRQYRKVLAGNTEVVENLMCDDRWDEIEYEHVPSVAFSKYKAAFERHDPERFEEFLGDVEKGEAKIHAGAIFPHDVLGKAVLILGYGVVNRRAINAQWSQLPEYEAPGGTLVVADVSGSMTAGDALPLRVSVSLGLYFAERLPGPFKNIVCTFSQRPNFFRLPDAGIVEKARAVAGMDWMGNTDLEAVLRLMLDQATKHNLAAEKMPGNILILSDMQFDYCMVNADETAMQMMRRMYEEAGYQMPQVIFWNLRSSIGIPAKMNEAGVALLSGFSPSLMRNVMAGVADPLSVMMRTLNNERYDRVVV